MSNSSDPVDLRAEFGPVRDQGRRPTCLAFAASAAHEHLRTVRDVLSPEALFIGSKSRDGLPKTAGTTVPAMTTTLREDGQCLEEEWPYGTAGPPRPGSVFYRAVIVRSGAGDVLKFIQETLVSGAPAVLIAGLTSAWFIVGKDGIIDPPSTSDQLLGYHAVVGVGYDAVRGLLLIRNSWGEGWGESGYAQLPFAHVDRHSWAGLRLAHNP